MPSLLEDSIPLKANMKTSVENVECPLRPQRWSIILSHLPGLLTVSVFIRSCKRRPPLKDQKTSESHSKTDEGRPLAKGPSQPGNRFR